MSYPITHVALAEDGEINLHEPTTPTTEVCDCGRPARWLILADGGPGWICQECPGDLDWEVRAA